MKLAARVLGAKRSKWFGPAAALMLCAVCLAPASGARAEEDASGSPFLQIMTAARAVFTVAPADGRVERGFGAATDPRTGRTAFHPGVDYHAAEGAAVVAPGPGRVTRVAPNQPGYGNLLEIDHGNGLVTRYAHLSAFDVSVNETVEAGQVIARVGHTGVVSDANGPRLHFEVWTTRLREGEQRFIDPQFVVPPLRG